MNKIGVCCWSLPQGTARERIELAARSGLSGVQLELGTEVEQYPLSNQSLRDEYRALRDALGMAYPSLGMNVFCEHAATRRESAELLRNAIDLGIDTALDLGIPLLQVPSFKASSIRNVAGLEQTIELFRYACEQAANTSLLIGSENVLNPVELEQLVEGVAAPNFRIYFDTANPAAMTGVSAVTMLDASLPHLVETHLKDSRADRTPVLLGEGESGFFEVAAHLAASDYAGWLVLENPYERLMAARGLSAEALLRKDVTTIRECFGLSAD
ncbi:MULTISPECIES: sugar phosphate isomerase/epimerase [unclassified Lentimonas]|uniref:sugar phosphate isomerase/epimerase family protein n=1 Tax=unclassified Lentimonas TaxID=2630993 RepID=UPI001322D55B|nr:MULTISPECIES: TIM barrel protein [unclassified Lentimonas]CAA6679019.1 Unannotated [Lentimonas sp. CC4]CAA6684240.1 Unannotated [Lentimonas sp. CC6]CAA7076386.1 Unannotated [Lentimonas sp. CC4]CAA7171812.1 Unannotated [Lentimonas sp. CC21]CAA7183142.1 Unannotated [Lentimonas sp. CC8]